MDEEQGLKEQPESELRSRNQPHILWAARVAASLAIVAAFCFVPVRLFFQNLSDSAGMQNLTQPTVLSPPTDNYYGPPTEIYPYGSSDVCVAFEFLNMDPATSFATFGIVVGLAPPGRQPIRQWVKGGDTLLLRIGSNVGLSSILIPVSTSALQPVLALPRDQPSSACNNGSKSRYIRGAGFRMLQNIFVLGQPRAFPNAEHVRGNEDGRTGGDGSKVFVVRDPSHGTPHGSVWYARPRARFRSTGASRAKPIRASCASSCISRHSGTRCPTPSSKSTRTRTTRGPTQSTIRRAPSLHSASTSPWSTCISVPGIVQTIAATIR